MVYVLFTTPTKQIPAPPGWSRWLPFQIYWNESTSQYIIRGWDISTQVPTTGNDIYVSTTGNDAGAGTDIDPFGSVSHAISVAGNNDTIWIEAGVYSYNVTPAGGWDAQAVNNLTLSFKRWGVGDVIISHHEILIWAASGVNSYTATVGAAIYDVRDASVVDGAGDYEQLTEQASAAAVDANAGSWYTDGVDVWIRLSDDRVPDSDVRPYVTGVAAYVSRTSIVYAENIIFHGGNNTFYALALNSPPATVYMNNCVFKYAFSNGFSLLAGTVYLQNCLAARNDLDGYKGDEYQIDGIGTFGSPFVVMIDSDARHNGDGGSADNGSSLHGGTNALATGHIVRINGEHHHNDGPELNDIENCQSWCLNVYCHDTDPASSINFALSTGKMWLDRCISEDAATDLQASSDGTIYYRNLSSGGSFSELTGGAIEEY